LTASDINSGGWWFYMKPANGRGIELSDECWLCSSPVNETGSISAIPDMKQPGMAILTPICGDCYRLASSQRLLREMNTIKQMWPTAKFNGWRTASKKKRK
jgi:hypothetical protein